MYELTEEQSAIIAEICNPSTEVLSVCATAGSSKSYTICESIKQLTELKPGTICQCLIFNTVPAAELQSEIGDIAIVSTLHSLAYQHTVKPRESKLNRNIAGWLTWRDIPKDIKKPFGMDGITLDHIESFCKSGHLTVEAYFAEFVAQGNRLHPGVEIFAKKLLNRMANGTMRITHSFYLKLFHTKVMSGAIKLNPVDLLIIDEAQDSSSITLDIFERIPSTHRVLVGDRSQRIYEFLKLEDGFKRYPDAKVLTLSKSFRVDRRYASGIQSFLRKHLESDDTVFEGMDYTGEQPIVTKAYLTRTNASLIGKMIELNQCGTPYKLAHKTKLDQMFKLPKALIYAKPGHDQKDPELQHLQSDIDDWGRLSTVQQAKISKLSWILKQNKEDQRIQQAAKLILKFGREAILAADKQASAHKKVVCDYTLSTGFAVKGSTFDAVELDPDVEDSIADLLDKPQNLLEPEERAELAHVFVCYTRHRHVLTGANYLEELMELT